MSHLLNVYILLLILFALLTAVAKPEAMHVRNAHAAQVLDKMRHDRKTSYKF